MPSVIFQQLPNQYYRHLTQQKENSLAHEESPPPRSFYEKQMMNKSIDGTLYQSLMHSSIDYYRMAQYLVNRAGIGYRKQYRSLLFIKVAYKFNGAVNDGFACGFIPLQFNFRFYFF